MFILRELFKDFIAATGPFAHRKALVERYKPKAWRSQSTAHEITSAFNRISRLLRPTGGTMGDAVVSELGRRDFTVIREALINAEYAIKTINTTLGRFREFLKICYRLELIEINLVTMADVCAGNVRADEPGVTRKVPIRSVPFEHVEATIAAAPALTASVIRVLLHTGMRPSEAAAIRIRDVEPCGRIWRYMPHTWKTEHKDVKPKAVRIGPRAMAALEERRLDVCDVPPLFAGLASVPSWGDPAVATFLFPWGHRPGGIDLDSAVETIRDRIQRAAKLAGVPTWSTNQLRHLAATQADRRGDAKLASTLLGHADERLTKAVYIDPAEPHNAEADEYVEQFG